MKQNLAQKTETISNVQYERQLRLLLSFCLVLSTWLLYWPVLRFDFVNLDDPIYVYENPYVYRGLSVEGFFWALTSFTNGLWHPATWFSFMLDGSIFGAKPIGFHLTNLWLHIINVILVFLWLEKCTRLIWQSAFIAALFALHPLNVESVAWVSERKGLLSACACLIALIEYQNFLQHRKLVHYVLTFIFGGLGMLAKPTVVTLPFLLLLVDYWQSGASDSFHQRFNFSLSENRGLIQFLSRVYQRLSLRLVVEKLPFFALAAGGAVVALVSEHSAGAVQAVDFWARVQNVILSYFRYIRRLFWPSDLAILYPRHLEWPAWEVFCGIFLICSASAVALSRHRRRSNCFLFGWLWFLIGLLPVIGLIPIGPHSMADRYAYIPMLGLFILVTFFMEDLRTQLKRRDKRLYLAFCSLLLILCFVTASHQLQYWKSSSTALTRALEVTADNPLAHNNLGVVLASQGKLEDAEFHFREAARCEPGFSLFRRNLGLTLEQKGELKHALNCYRFGLAVNPTSMHLYLCIGDLYRREGKIDLAISHYRLGIMNDPNDALLCDRLALILGTYPDTMRRNLMEAIQLASKAVALSRGKDARILATLAACQREAGNTQQTLKTAELAYRVAVWRQDMELAVLVREQFKLSPKKGTTP